jgi:hypothetical protein
MEARDIAKEPLRAARVRPEELEALKNWQSRSQMQGAGACGRDSKVKKVNEIRG